MPLPPDAAAAALAAFPRPLKARALGTNRRLGWLKHAQCTASRSIRFLVGRVERVAPMGRVSVALAQ